MTIYRLSEYRFYGTDPSDGERVEERRILGYFSDRSKLAEALLACRRCGIGEEETAVEEFSVPLRRGRRFSMSSPMSFPCGAEKTLRIFTTSSGRKRAVGSASGSSAAFRGRIRAFALPKERSTRSLTTASGSSAMRSTSCIPSLIANKRDGCPGSRLSDRFSRRRLPSVCFLPRGRQGAPPRG